MREDAGAEHVRHHVARGTLATLIALVALADVLFLGHRLGVSVAVFAVTLVLVVRTLLGPPKLHASDAGHAAILGLGLLPVVEAVQPLSLVFAGLAVLAVVVRIALGTRTGRGAPAREMASFAARYPLAATIEAPAGLGALLPYRPARRSGALVRSWLLPGGAGLVLAGLLLLSNPVLSLWATELGQLPPDLGTALRHAGFWAAAALLIRPFLAPKIEPASDPVQPSRSWAAPGWVNDASVLNALVVFNLLLGLQTALDLRYLWAGAALPARVTPAEYAQRGAYPLVATALLAGGFALLSQPFARHRPVLRALLGLWVAQNLLLVTSAALRLDLYVDLHGLTRLRVAAAIWMAVTAGGLGLTAWQVARGLCNGWLLARVAILGAVTLWLCCFLSVAGVVARANVERFERMGRLDRDYLCGLGPAAAPAVLDHLTRTGVLLCAADEVLPAPAPDWREWGFRDWRLRRYVAAAGSGDERA